MSAFPQKRAALLDALYSANTRYASSMKRGFRARLARALQFPIQTACRAVQTRFLDNKKNFAVSNTWFFGGQGVITSTEYDLWYVGALCASSEIDTARFLIQRIQPSATFFDIGSHHGYYALLADRLLSGTDGTIVAFEPAPFHFGLLRSNTNGTGIVPEQIALSDGEKMAPFYQSHFGTSTLDVHLTNRRQRAFEEVLVRCESLDQYCNRTGKLPDMMKVDIEGNEHAFLLGAREVVAHAKPDIMMEVWGGSQKGIYEAATSILLNAGYAAYEYSGTELTPISHAGQSLLSGHEGIQNIFFIHSDKAKNDL